MRIALQGISRRVALNVRWSSATGFSFERGSGDREGSISTRCSNTDQ
jgi:hypothetical protein